MNNRIGRFKIVREFGGVAQSVVVYLARDPHLQREVAIKTLHFSQTDPEKNQQLLAEARLVSQLRYPNIVLIFEAGEEQGDVYLQESWRLSKSQRSPDPGESHCDAPFRSRWDCPCPRGRNHSPRSQAEQYPDRQRWHAARDGLWQMRPR